jgi:hypothetical protein
MRTRGVLAIEPEQRRWILIPEQRQQLDTFAALAAIALERVHYIEVAQNALVNMEVRAAAQLAAGGAVARPAHAADVAGRPVRIAGLVRSRRWRRRSWMWPPRCTTKRCA